MKICLIDADSMIYITCYSKMTGEDADNYLAYKTSLDEWIDKTIKATESTHYLGFLTIGRVFRHKAATNREYKSGRPADKPKFYFELRKHLIDHWKFAFLDGLEAEDLVGVVNHYFKNIHTVTTTIAGIDHDLLQLPGRHYNFKTGISSEITDFNAQYNLWIQLLTGCTTDKIEGIPGIGPAKAKKLLTHDSPAGVLNYSLDICKNIVLDQYIKYYGMAKGIELFAETFKLCFLLRTPNNIEDAIGVVDWSIPEPIEYIITKTEEEELPWK
jgi:5'-3' exonuclease